jgi:hypothetical protein
MEISWVVMAFQLSDLVIPAEAGIQRAQGPNLSRFGAWILAFAGMTRVWEGQS